MKGQDSASALASVAPGRVIEESNAPAELLVTNHSCVVF